MKQWKRLALREANDQIIAVMDAGHDVKMMTDYHWRIDGVDVWPSSRKYMRAGWLRTKQYQKLNDIFP
jgi:hypothetical protein